MEKGGYSTFAEYMVELMVDAHFAEEAEK
jgi:hypothetical protein